LLNREIFDSLFEAKVLVERWRKEYNQIRPHSSLGYIPPAPESIYPTIQQFDKSFVN
ncbi:MAG TPA: integrase core domain-containing protein, partial [Candidatus Marinimicrobia bacterium]|nr:integrase core domain-containing protein [Candidatus Neomarinimicrobiota bacterium]